VIAALSFPQIDPIAISLGPFAIRWYALAYIGGLLIAWWYCRWLTTRPPRDVSPEAFDDFLLWATLGIVLGGRLGYVLFYKPGFYFANPLEIVMVWQGGMSFHGGLLGVAVAEVAFARRRGIPLFALTDIVACAAPVGLFLGRIANFVNGELFGRQSEAPWAVVFPSDVERLPRHPSQLYEAGLEGVLLFLALYVLVRLRALEVSGLLTGAFLIGYALARMAAELFREPDAHLGFLPGGVTMGQVLSLPMALAGLGLVIWAFRARA
jgi:phosphatidylglycerol:prolipoprotein diacylglycerol transferase